MRYSIDSPLLTDLYQLTMMQAYVEHGYTDTAVFELFVRKLPERRNFLVAAGLAQVVDFLDRVSFSADELNWLNDHGGFSPSFAIVGRCLILGRVLGRRGLLGEILGRQRHGGGRHRVVGRARRFVVLPGFIVARA